MIKQIISNPFIIGKKEDLIQPPIAIRIGDFDDSLSKIFSDELEKAHNTGQPVIPLIIDSYGGYAYTLIDIINQIQSSKLPVVTILEGKGMSCGAILFAMGKERYMAPNATLMFHDVSAGAMGKVEEIKASSKQIEKIQKLVFGLAAKNIGQKEDYITKILYEKNHAEWYMDAKEAKKHNICTHIGIPTLTATISLNYTFGIN